MKKVLILGAGLVAKPLVRYLLDQPDFQVEVASRTVSKAVRLIDNHPRGTAKSLNLKDKEGLRNEIKNSDLVISMVPYTFHTTVAKYCIEFGKHMVTTSYVSTEMKSLDGRAKDAGIMILNEIGLDPGIDHMEAMRIIHEAEDKGGEITGFTSYCGGLPAPEANTNPFGYKFSWSPIGVLLAGKNSARYLKNGEIVNIASEDLFNNYAIMPIEGLGQFEGYPNRDSIPYIDLYGIQSTKTMLRGTLRNLGWCATLKKIVELGILDQEEKDWEDCSYQKFMRGLIHASGESDIRNAVAAHLKIDPNSEIMHRLEWLGLLSDDPVPIGKGGAIDILAARMIEKMSFEKGERDMIVLEHTFETAYPDGKRERIVSTLIDYGIPHGDSAMARTVGLPPAIGTKLILEGKIDKTGVHIPVQPDIYKPLLQELKKLDIEFQENKETL
ncbi:MAG: saccharopine dehydrogenase NADP-binding domain-containing protein [Candidatus Aminicenantes bacterium]|nr:saccharopine dehydrogenase NADP-binding domain-containing protein [Candidatus Aminicenantes bacterium]